MLQTTSRYVAHIVPAQDDEPGALTVAVFDLFRDSGHSQRWPGFWKYKEAEDFARTRIGPVRAILDSRGDHG